MKSWKIELIEQGRVSEVESRVLELTKSQRYIADGKWTDETTKENTAVLKRKTNEGRILSG